MLEEFFSWNVDLPPIGKVSQHKRLFFDICSGRRGFSRSFLPFSGITVRFRFGGCFDDFNGLIQGPFSVWKNPDGRNDLEVLWKVKRHGRKATHHYGRIQQEIIEHVGIGHAAFGRNQVGSMLSGSLLSQDIGKEMNFRAGIFLSQIGFCLLDFQVQWKFEIGFKSHGFEIRP